MRPGARRSASSARTVAHSSPSARPRIRDRVALFAGKQLIHLVDRKAGNGCERSDRLFVLSIARKPRERFLIEPARLVQVDNGLLRRGKVALDALHVAVRRHLDHRPRKLGLPRRACRLNILRRTRSTASLKQLLQQRRRQVVALPHRNRQHAVVGGALHQAGIALHRERRGRVARHASHDLALAAAQDHVGDVSERSRRAARSPAGAAALSCARSRSASVRRSAAKPSSSGPAHPDRVVLDKLAHHRGRRIDEGGKPQRQDRRGPRCPSEPAGL